MGPSGFLQNNSCVGSRNNMDNENPMDATLKDLTDGFSDERILVRGTFGVMYKGKEKDREEIGVNVLYSLKGVDDERFLTELKNLKKLNHNNVLKVVGFCNEKEEVPVEFQGKKNNAIRIRRALCFEYMKNGSLQEHLSDEHPGLDWNKRYSIIKGICNGLKYLHEEFAEPIYHLDLKPDNILLDKEMVPKIAYFGLSRHLGEENTKVTTADVGTHWYIPPEYINNDEFSKEFDIYSLGVTILKIIIGPTAHPSIGDEKAAEFAEQVRNNWWERLHKEPKSTSLETDCQQVKKCTEIALMCIKKEMKVRPTIGDLVKQLDEIEKQQNNSSHSIKKVEETTSPYSNIPARPSPEVETEASRGKIPENNKNPQGTLPHSQTLEYFKKITNDFSDELKLSEDAFGTVYKGDGQVTVVKKHVENTVLPAGKQFLREVTNLMLVQHENLPSLLSFCSEPKEKVWERKGQYFLIDTDEYVLCYENACKGSLRDHLSDDANGIDWATRFKIIKGICQGLHFLHERKGGPIVHMDLQPANILLDANMVPKIANFSLSRLFGQEQTKINTQNVVGQKGYMAPEYVYSGEISPQCDIYSLGVLMMEMATREKSDCSDDKDMSARSFIASIRQTWTDEHIASKYSSFDPNDIQDVKTCIDIGLKCVDVAQKNRPSIVEIVNIFSRKRGI